MIRRAQLRLAASALSATLLISLPATAGASDGPSPTVGSGGVSLSGASATTGTAPGAQAQPGNRTVTASGNGITVQTTESGLLRQQLQFTGTVPASDAGDTVEIERQGSQTAGQWTPTATGTVGPDGSFTVIWRANHIGQFAVEAVIGAGTQASVASARSGAAPTTITAPAPAGPASPALDITVYRPSLATFYGPGLFGRRTACGQRLRRTTLGVASRTLPCGTPVAVYYGGRTITVPVIDRGPYAHGADWDLTSATAAALGMTTTATIGAVSLPGTSSPLPAS